MVNDHLLKFTQKNHIIMKTQITFILSLILSVSMYAQELSADNTIVKNASLSDSHKTLVKAVKAAGLAETFSGEGPFTVFAPTDQAFSKIPGSTLKKLLKTENKKKLKAVLTYHVVEGDIKAEDVVKLIKSKDGEMKVATVNGGKLTFSLDYGDVQIKDQNGNTARVEQANLTSSNGVIHVIDTVLMP